MKALRKPNKNKLLEKFRSKARCVHSQKKAYNIWNKLEPLLDKTEVAAIMIAWGHFDIGEGPEELDEICKGLIRD